MMKARETTMNENKPAEQVTSPKVTAGAIAGAAAAVAGAMVLGAVEEVTPEHFAALGMWANVAYGAVVAGAGAVAAYIKRDPRRV